MSWDEFDEQKQSAQDSHAAVKQLFHERFLQSKGPAGITRARALAIILEGISRQGIEATRMVEASTDAEEKAMWSGCVAALQATTMGVMATMADIHEPVSFSN